MVEMEMRVDDEIDLAGVAVDRLQPGADLLAGPETDAKQPHQPLAETAGRIVLAIDMEAGVEQRAALGMLDQIDRDGHGDLALAALHQMGELAGDRAAGKGVKSRRAHAGPNFTGICKSIPRAVRWRR